MNEGLARRVAYYTRKVAEYGSVHPARKRPRAHAYRNDRLLAYKAALHQRIDKEDITNENRICASRGSR